MSRSIATSLFLVFPCASFLSVELGAQAGQERRRVTTLTSDRADYPPGVEALLTGAGFAPGEDVSLVVLHADGTPSDGEGHDPWTVAANDRGRFRTTWHVCEDDCVGSLLVARAEGALSGLSAEVLFTDNHECGDGVVTAVTPVGGACSAFTPAVGNGPDNYEVQEGGTYMMTISGVTECVGDTITVFIQSSNTGNFCFNATGGAGVYTGTFTMPDPACNTLPVSYKCGADAACNHPGSLGAQGPTSGCGGVHLRASLFDGACNRTGADTDCDADCDPASSVQLGSPCPGLLTISPPIEGGISTAVYDGNLPGRMAFFLYGPPGTPFFFQGCEYFLDPPFNLGATVVLDGNGNGQVLVPNASHPCGQEIVVQTLVIDMTGIAEVSNGVLLTIGS